MVASNPNRHIDSASQYTNRGASCHHCLDTKGFPDGGPEGLDYQANMSDCTSGFPMSGDIADTWEDPNCSWEMLSWTYDADTGVLSIDNTGVLMHCCMAMDLSVEMDEETYVLRAMDRDPTVACDCICTFDLTFDIAILSAAPVTVRILRAAESTTAQEVWEGTLDLTEGSGEISIEERNC